VDEAWIAAGALPIVDSRLDLSGLVSMLLITLGLRCQVHCSRVNINVDVPTMELLEEFGNPYRESNECNLRGNGEPGQDMVFYK